MKNRFLHVVMLLLMTLGVSCQEKENFQSISVFEFKELIKDSSVIVIDVRTVDEYIESHIPDTDLNIDVLKDDFVEIINDKLPKKSTVAIYCRSGNRSKKAATQLSNAGHKVFELSTGIKGWISEGEEVERNYMNE